MSRDINDKVAEVEAISSLGAVHLLMDDVDGAMKYHQQELELARNLRDIGLQARACSNIAGVHEATGKLEESIKLHEQSLGLAATAADQVVRASAFANLGRLHHLNGKCKLDVKPLILFEEKEYFILRIVLDFRRFTSSSKLSPFRSFSFRGFRSC